MHAVEFTTELGEQPIVTIPQEVAAQLPKAGQARIIILTADDPDDAQRHRGTYDQFIRDDSPEDAAEVEVAWEAEIARRVERVQQGTAKGRPAEDVFRDLRARYQ